MWSQIQYHYVEKYQKRICKMHLKNVLKQEPILNFSSLALVILKLVFFPKEKSKRVSILNNDKVVCLINRTPMK